MSVSTCLNNAKVIGVSVMLGISLFQSAYAFSGSAIIYKIRKDINLTVEQGQDLTIPIRFYAEPLFFQNSSQEQLSDCAYLDRNPVNAQNGSAYTCAPVVRAHNCKASLRLYKEDPGNPGKPLIDLDTGFPKEYGARQHHYKYLGCDTWSGYVEIDYPVNIPKEDVTIDSTRLTDPAIPPGKYMLAFHLASSEGPQYNNWVDLGARLSGGTAADGSGTATAIKFGPNTYDNPETPGIESIPFQVAYYIGDLTVTGSTGKKNAETTYCAQNAVTLPAHAWSAANTSVPAPPSNLTCTLQKVRRASAVSAFDYLLLSQ